MKTKIKEALKQEYKNLGLADEVFERVASSVETFITDEAQIPNYVKGAEGLLKTFQSTGDKARTDAATEKKRADDLQAQLDALKKDKTDKGDDDANKGGDDKPDLAATIANAVAAAIKPLQDKIDAYDGAATAKEAINTAKDTFYANDYVKKYKAEADDAWERATELNAATGSKMNSEELQTKAMGYFNNAVKRIGVDTTQPFKSEGADEGTADWSAEKKRLQENGRLPKDTK